jgi:glutamate-1-semialdehyde aminotransferase
LEPVQLDDSAERIKKLRELRKICSDRGIVLIFDEVITGLRYPSGSVSRYHEIHPDLICCGKAFGNGEKTGFVAGNKDIMDGNYFVSGTYFGHLRSLAAIKESIWQHGIMESSSLNSKTSMTNRAFNEAQPEIVKIEGWGNRGNFVGTPENVAIFRQEMFKLGWYTKTTLVWNWCNYVHDGKFLEDSYSVLDSIKNGKAKLEYSMPKTAVAAKIRGNRT